MPFDSPDLVLGDLLREVGPGKVQLPDFQREWKWDDPHISSLLASVSLGHPVGVVMTLETGGAGVQFAPKPLAGVPLPAASPPQQLLLDGQQRLTSLYQALMAGVPVDTTDPRGKRLRRWYYLDLAAALDPEGDREDAVVSVPEDRKLRDNFGREIVADYSTAQLECAAEMFPLSIVFDTPATNKWMVTYLQLNSDDMPARLERWSAFAERVLANITSYAVPVIRLHKETPKEAVCTVFEKVNTSGVALNVFELLTATFASSNFRLKDDWAGREAMLRIRPVLRSLESADFLQAVSLLTTFSRRQQYLGAGGDPSSAPGVSCKRKDVLRLTLSDYLTWADQVQAAFAWVAQFLGQEHIFRADDLPYRTQLVPLAAIKTVLGADADTHGAFDKLRQWFWCGVLGELYGGAIETRFARDLEQMVAWIGSGGPLPGTVAESAFREPRLLSLRTRNSAAYKGVYALLMRDQCLDWVKHQPMNMAAFFEFVIDIHHVFPKAWCDKNGVDHGRRESIVNKTAISYSTNRSIGGRSPAEYMATLASKAGVGDERIDEIVATHKINPAHLRVADFDAYFGERKEALLGLISAAMGKEAIRDETALQDHVSEFVEDNDDVEDLGEATAIAS
ncbi:MAG: GmrSD restriction endonuclease domain-containing protein [Acidimicrobiales bacterium]